MECWDVRDRKEDYLNWNRSSREREADKIRALRHDEFQRSRLRSRGMVE